MGFFSTWLSLDKATIPDWWVAPPKLELPSWKPREKQLDEAYHSNQFPFFTTLTTRPFRSSKMLRQQLLRTGRGFQRLSGLNASRTFSGSAIRNAEVELTIGV